MANYIVCPCIKKPLCIHCNRSKLYQISLCCKTRFSFYKFQNIKNNDLRSTKYKLAGIVVDIEYSSLSSCYSESTRKHMEFLKMNLDNKGSDCINISHSHISVCS